MANIKLSQGAQGASLQNTFMNVTSPSPWQNLSSGSITLNDLLETGHGDHVKKYEILEIEEDLLALSVTWKRLRDATKKGAPYIPVGKLLDKELFEHVTDPDREKAAEIRDYYSKKLMVWKLKGTKLSQFREDMNSFIHSNGKMFKNDMIPLVYRLPEFHEYDIGFDNLVSEHNKVISNKTKGVQTKTLTLQKNFIKGKRYSKRKEYWFTDEDDNLVTLSLVHDNPLMSLLDLQCKNKITLLGKYDIQYRDNNEYYVVDKYSFL